LAPPGFEHPDQGDAQRLWNLAPRIPEERRFSRKFHECKELIDHILVSGALVHHIQSADSTSEPDSVTEDPTERKDVPGSDHAMVFATFEIG
jgi:hypothetical protein